MRLIPALLVAAVVALPATAAAQKLAPGKWTGTIAPPDNAAIEATFDVSMAGDTTKITINAAGRVMETTNVKVEKDRVLFGFAPGGTSVQCTLLVQPDKSYTGDCLDSGGGKGVIVIRPPKP
jgi:hypothetical protein